MLNLEIISQKGSTFAQSLSSCLGKKLINVEVQDFADTETYIKFSDVELIKNKNLCVIQQFSFSNKDLNSVNNQILKFLLLVDFLKKAGAKKIVAVLPYLPYSRQDKSYYDKYVGAINFIGKIFKTAGLEKIIACDLHESDIQNDFVVDLNEILLSFFWADFIKGNFNTKNIYLVSPDEGHRKTVKAIAEKLNVEFGYIEKERVGSDRTKALKFIGDARDKTIFLIDDIIDTANTAVNACAMLKDNGAKKIIGCFSHGVFTQGSIEKIEKDSFERIFVTDSIVQGKDVIGCEKISIVSIVNLICDFLKSNNF